MEKAIAVTPRKKSARGAGYWVAKTLSYAVLSLFALVFLIPFVFAVVTSFTTPNGIYAELFEWIPNPVTVENYIEVFKKLNLVRGFLNTMLYIMPPILVGVLTSSMAAYAFAKLNFPGKNIVFAVFLSTMVIPGIITTIPSYLLFASIYNWVGTPLPLIVPGMFGAAMTMFFIKQFMMTLPKELEEAARIDGMNYGGIFLKIILPLSKPVLITQIVLSFNGAYNDYFTPLLYLGSKPELHTIQLMVSTLQTQFTQPYTLMMAGSIVALLPTFVLFMFAQRFFVEGIVVTGLKG